MNNVFNRCMIMFNGCIKVFNGCITYAIYFDIDTYSCARALKHALKNPLLLTNINKSSQLVTSTTTTPQVFQYLKKTVTLMFNVHPHTLSLSLSLALNRTVPQHTSSEYKTTRNRCCS